MMMMTIMMRIRMLMMVVIMMLWIGREGIIYRSRAWPAYADGD